MPKTRSAISLLTRLMEYRQKNLLKKLSEGWSLTAATNPNGQLLSVSLIDEVGHFQSHVSNDDLDLFLDLDLIEGCEAPRKSRFDIMNYTLRKVA